jgi:hypothetical protein
MGQELISKIRTIVMAMILVSLLSGCGGTETQPSVLAATRSATGTKIILIATTQPVSSAQNSTSSPTLLPSTPTRWPTDTSTPSNTSSPQPSVTWTALPTLATIEAQQTVTAFYENNGGCELPCWWGITPGKTTWPEVRADLSPLATEKGPFKVGKRGAIAYDYYFPFPMRFHPYDLVDFGPRIVIQDGIVFDVGISSAEIRHGQDTSLAGLLRLLGAPDEIWIKMPSESMNNRPAYELQLFYPNKGVLLGRFGSGYLSKESVLFCPQMPDNHHYPYGLALFAPSPGITFESLTETILSRDTSVYKFHLLRDLIDSFSEADFYRLYSDPATDKCLTIPIDKLR